MFQKIQSYVDLIKGIAQQRIFKWLVSMWAIVAAYDLVVSQFIPEEYAKGLPKAWQIAVTTGNMLPFWAWLLILAFILVIGSFEYALNVRRSTIKAAKAPPQTDFGIPEYLLNAAIQPYGSGGKVASTQSATLRLLSSADLRSRAMQVAQALRNFEMGHRSQEAVRMERQSSAMSVMPVSDEAARNVLWQAHSIDNAEVRGQFQREAMTRYHAEAVMIWNELKQRTGNYAPAARNHSPSFLELGMLAGPNPLTHAAESIEALAQQLI